MPEWYLLHPAWVHFPIALLISGLAASAWREARGKPEWLGQAVSWLLWLGTAAAWIAIALGQLAENTAPHVPSAWQTLNAHESLAYWTAGFFSCLSIWRYAIQRGWAARTKLWSWVFLGAWLIGAGLLLATAYHGGELVFTHGMGVKQPE